MSNQWTSTTALSLQQWSDSKPTNPVEGDSYYDKVTNKLCCYIRGSWIDYQVYATPSYKNEIRKEKIKNLLK
jgi:hypothetical protein